VKQYFGEIIIFILYSLKWLADSTEPARFIVAGHYFISPVTFGCSSNTQYQVIKNFVKVKYPFNISLFKDFHAVTVKPVTRKLPVNSDVKICSSA
jgi:hypothetical protein